MFHVARWKLKKAVFRIRDVLLGIRIRTTGLTDPDPAVFFSDFQDANKK
jgi:hypothetical protein